MYNNDGTLLLLLLFCFFLSSLTLPTLLFANVNLPSSHLVVQVWINLEFYHGSFAIHSVFQLSPSLSSTFAFMKINYFRIPVMIFTTDLASLSLCLLFQCASLLLDLSRLFAVYCVHFLILLFLFYLIFLILMVNILNMANRQANNVYSELDVYAEVHVR